MKSISIYLKCSFDQSDAESQLLNETTYDDLDQLYHLHLGKVQTTFINIF